MKHSHSFTMTIFHKITKSAKLVILLIIPTYAKVSIQKILTIFLVNQGVFYGYFALLFLCAKHQSLPDVHSIEPWVHFAHR